METVVFVCKDGALLGPMTYYSMSRMTAIERYNKEGPESSKIIGVWKVKEWK